MAVEKDLLQVDGRLREASDLVNAPRTPALCHNFVFVVFVVVAGVAIVVVGVAIIVVAVVVVVVGVAIVVLVLVFVV